MSIIKTHIMENKVLVSDESRGMYSSEEIEKFSKQSANDYLHGNPKEELESMTLKDKITLIKELEYNFQF